MTDRHYLHGMVKENWGMVLSILTPKARKQAKDLRVKVEDLDLELMQLSDTYIGDYKKPMSNYIYFYTHKHTQNRALRLILESAAHLHYGSW